MNNEKQFSKEESAYLAQKTRELLLKHKIAEKVEGGIQFTNSYLQILESTLEKKTPFFALAYSVKSYASESSAEEQKAMCIRVYLEIEDTDLGRLIDMDSKRIGTVESGDTNFGSYLVENLKMQEEGI